MPCAFAVWCPLQSSNANLHFTHYKKCPLPEESWCAPSRMKFISQYRGFALKRPPQFSQERTFVAYNSTKKVSKFWLLNNPVCFKFVCGFAKQQGNHYMILYKILWCSVYYKRLYGLPSECFWIVFVVVRLVNKTDRLLKRQAYCWPVSPLKVKVEPCHCQSVSVLFHCKLIWI